MPTGGGGVGATAGGGDSAAASRELAPTTAVPRISAEIERHAGIERIVIRRH